MECDIRYSQIEDGQDLFSWISDPETNRWFPMSTPEEIREGAKNWIGFSRFRSSLTATVQSKPVGIGTLFLLPYQKVSHQCSFYLVVAPERRRQGIGSSMVKNLLNLAQNYFRFESVYAEVYEGCPILEILKKFSFESIAYQERFVKEENQYRSRIILEHMF
jgi:RimJ/RimL family protein N-acetyltransferase